METIRYILGVVGVFITLYTVPYVIFKGIADGLGRRGKKYNITINNHSDENLTIEELKYLIKKEREKK